VASLDDALDVVDAYCSDDSHGYELRSRDFDAGTDCAGLVTLYLRQLGYAVGDDLHTDTMRADLPALGIPWHDGLDGLARGDVLLTARTPGHTVIVDVPGTSFWGAEGDWDGRPGDGAGTEVEHRGWYDRLDGGWAGYFRPATTANDTGDSAQEEEEDMNECIVDFNGTGRLVWIDGAGVPHWLDEPDTAESVRMVYRLKSGGKEIPEGTIGSPDAPWMSRYLEAHGDGSSELPAFTSDHK